MTGIYVPIGRWAGAARVFSLTTENVRRAGRDGKESGILWLGKRDATAKIIATAFPSGTGVEESPGHWRISPEVFGTVSRWAAPRNLCLLGVAHIHLPGVPARLSRTDRDCGVQIPGILEVIIGDGGEELDYRKWSWYVFEHGDYQKMSISELGDRVSVNHSIDFEHCTVNAEGVLFSTEEP